jgi:glutamine amidotransferase-like uncharacterized protein
MSRFTKNLQVLLASMSLVGSLSACNGGNTAQASAEDSSGGSTPMQTSPETTGGDASIATGPSNPTQPNNPSNPAPTPTATTTPTPSTPARTYATDALLFVGDGTWSPEVGSLQSLMKARGMTYQNVNSAQLDAMSVDDIAKFGLLIFPGGSGGTQAGSLSSDTHARLRAAVQERGVSYIGFCAGAFIGMAPKPAAGRDVSYGLGVVDGPVLDYYYLENQGVSAAMTMNTFADGTKRDLLWYGGPTTPNTPGTVISKYPNGDAAISEMWSGKGFVILSGPHPAAPESVKSSLGVSDSDGSDLETAWSLLQSALKQAPLPTFAN